jgi:hypothetical protein
MKSRTFTLLISFFAALIMASVAEAGTGTLKLTFLYKNPATGIDTKLTKGYVYLRSAGQSPPMERFYSKADYILGPTDTYGNMTKTVPEGSYFIRINQRIRTFPTWPPNNGAYGPPEPGDHTWMSAIPIKIVAGQTLNLGTIYAYPFASAPITITGTVKNYLGQPLSGRYVKVHTERCTDWWNDGYVNQCGPVKIHAQRPTDANGKYTVYLREPGTYNLMTHTSWDTDPGCSGYCAAPIVGTFGATVTVKFGDQITQDLIGY